MIGVTYEGFAVGRLTRLESGAPRFAYDPRWLGTAAAFPVSLILPLRPEPYDGAPVANWLWNLLPAAPARAKAARALGVEADDPLGLIARLGREAPGGLVFIVENDADESTAPDLRRIPDDSALERLLEHWIEHPLLIGDAEASMTHGRGAPWIPVAVEAGSALSLPLKGGVGTHWLEPENPRRPGLLESRAFCLELARLCGLEATRAEAGRARSRRYLLIERADRHEGKDGRWIRLHQEDLAQAAGFAPEVADQRRLADGLGFGEMFAIADAHLSAKDRLHLLDAVIFRALLGDVDADGKSALALLTGGVRLAPIQELATQGPWPRERDQRCLAHRFGGRRLRPDQLRAEDWKALAACCGLNPTFTARRVEDLAVAIAENGGVAVDRLAASPALNAPILDYFRREAEDTSATVAGNATRGVIPRRRYRPEQSVDYPRDDRSSSGPPP